jgi:uncharacterized protein (DUF488 family)
VTDRPSRLSTVGYEGRGAAELVELMTASGIDTVADVRLTPLSRKAGLSKRGLAQSLAAAGLAYVHLPALGNPRDNRDGFRRGETTSWHRFRARLDEPDPQWALAELGERIQAEQVALLCFERDPAQCHRRAISEWLARAHPGLIVTDLGT